jgi:hypothetical protein
VSVTPAETAPLATRPPGVDRGGALSFPIVMAIFGVLLAFGLTLAVVIHRSYVGFERVAAHHVPPDTTLVVRWDVEKVSLFEPTRKFLLPLLDEPHATAPNGASAPNGAPAPTPESRRDLLARESGTMVSRDLREVVALFGPGEHDWAVVLAGSFAKGDLIAAAARTFQQEGWGWRSLGPDRLAAPEGPTLGRAADGAVVLASSPARLDAVLVSRPLLPEVPREGAGALRLLPVSAGLPAGTTPLLDALGHPAKVSAEAVWGSPLPVHLFLHFDGQPPADVKERVHRALALLLPEDLDRIEQREAPVSVQSAGNHDLRVTVLLDDITLEHAANRAAQAVERAFQTPPGQDLAK